eukprot:10094882-Alexandrium_andersonii.AAC.1
MCACVCLGCIPAANVRSHSELRLGLLFPMPAFPGVPPSWMHLALRPGAVAPQNAAIATPYRQPLGSRP